MSDLICRKTMMRCQTPSMCAPHGGCSTGVLKETSVRYSNSSQSAEAEGVEAPVVATLLIDEVFHGSNGPEAGDWDIEHNPGVTEKLAQQYPGEAFDLVRQVDHLAALSAVTAEVEGLRKDADRYRKLKSAGPSAAGWLAMTKTSARWDEAIDEHLAPEAAMSAKEA